MPICRDCKDEVDELVTIKVKGRNRKLCEDCADRLREEMEIAGEAEAAMRGMMEYKGKW
jgi:hypothetical protein